MNKTLIAVALAALSTPAVARGRQDRIIIVTSSPRLNSIRGRARLATARPTILTGGRAILLALDTTAAIRFFLPWRRLRSALLLFSGQANHARWQDWQASHHHRHREGSKGLREGRATSVRTLRGEPSRTRAQPRNTPPWYQTSGGGLTSRIFAIAASYFAFSALSASVSSKPRLIRHALAASGLRGHGSSSG
jgi:hypothetical protein